MARGGDIEAEGALAEAAVPAGAEVVGASAAGPPWTSRLSDELLSCDCDDLRPLTSERPRASTVGGLLGAVLDAVARAPGVDRASLQMRIDGDRRGDDERITFEDVDSDDEEGRVCVDICGNSHSRLFDPQQ